MEVFNASFSKESHDMRTTRTRKATFNLSEQILRSLDDAVTKGAAPSKNAFVEHAISEALRAARQAEVRGAWAEASRDPLFRRDIEDAEREFESADAETAREIG